jgi:hypothetical protein
VDVAIGGQRAYDVRLGKDRSPGESRHSVSRQTRSRRGPEGRASTTRSGRRLPYCCQSARSARWARGAPTTSGFVRVCCAVPDGYVVTGFDEARGHARRPDAKPNNRNFAHVTPRLARDSCGLLARPRGVSGFTIRWRPCRNGRRWPGNGRRRPTDRGGSCCPGRGVPPTVPAQRHNPPAGACCRP